jgi:hypothetical protein
MPNPVLAVSSSNLNTLAGTKRSFPGNAESLPSWAPAKRGKPVQPPGAEVTVPGLSARDRPNRGSNVTVPYARVAPVSSYPAERGRIDPGDYVFVDIGDDGQSIDTTILTTGGSALRGEHVPTGCGHSMHAVYGMDKVNEMLQEAHRAGAMAFSDSALARVRSKPYEPDEKDSVETVIDEFEKCYELVDHEVGYVGEDGTCSDDVNGGGVKVPNAVQTIARRDALLKTLKKALADCLGSAVQSGQSMTWADLLATGPAGEQVADAVRVALREAHAVMVSTEFEQLHLHHKLAKTYSSKSGDPQWQCADGDSTPRDVLRRMRIDGVMIWHDEREARSSSSDRQAIYNIAIAGRAQVNNGLVVFDDYLRPWKESRVRPTAPASDMFVAHNDPGLLLSGQHRRVDIHSPGIGVHEHLKSQMFDRDVICGDVLYIGLFQTQSSLVVGESDTRGAKAAEAAERRETEGLLYYKPFSGRWLSRMLCVQSKIKYVASKFDNKSLSDHEKAHEVDKEFSRCLDLDCLHCHDLADLNVSTASTAPTGAMLEDAQRAVDRLVAKKTRTVRPKDHFRPLYGVDELDSLVVAWRVGRVIDTAAARGQDGATAIAAHVSIGKMMTAEELGVVQTNKPDKTERLIDLRKSQQKSVVNDLNEDKEAAEGEATAYDEARRQAQANADQLRKEEEKKTADEAERAAKEAAKDKEQARQAADAAEAAERAAKEATRAAEEAGAGAEPEKASQRDVERAAAVEAAVASHREASGKREQETALFKYLRTQTDAIANELKDLRAAGKSGSAEFEKMQEVLNALRSNEPVSQEVLRKVAALTKSSDALEQAVREEREDMTAGIEDVKRRLKTIENNDDLLSMVERGHFDVIGHMANLNNKIQFSKEEAEGKTKRLIEMVDELKQIAQSKEGTDDKLAEHDDMLRTMNAVLSQVDPRAFLSYVERYTSRSSTRSNSPPPSPPPSPLVRPTPPLGAPARPAVGGAALAPKGGARARAGASGVSTKRQAVPRIDSRDEYDC